uniref:Uncharacterized protein n=1 Tax=Manihot esculenta TaxID=3983 RepID=A0A2C9WEC7_MANES
MESGISNQMGQQFSTAGKNTQTSVHLKCLDPKLLFLL